MREEFEAWCEEELNLRTIRLSTGDYQSFGADMAWRAWQKAASIFGVQQQFEDLSASKEKAILEALKEPR